MKRYIQEFFLGLFFAVTIVLSVLYSLTELAFVYQGY